MYLQYHHLFGGVVGDSPSGQKCGGGGRISRKRGLNISGLLWPTDLSKQSQKRMVVKNLKKIGLEYRHNTKKIQILKTCSHDQDRYSFHGLVSKIRRSNSHFSNENSPSVSCENISPTKSFSTKSQNKLYTNAIINMIENSSFINISLMK